MFGFLTFNINTHSIPKIDRRETKKILPDDTELELLIVAIPIELISNSDDHIFEVGVDGVTAKVVDDIVVVVVDNGCMIFFSSILFLFNYFKHLKNLFSKMFFFNSTNIVVYTNYYFIKSVFFTRI